MLADLVKLKHRLVEFTANVSFASDIQLKSNLFAAQVDSAELGLTEDIFAGLKSADSQLVTLLNTKINEFDQKIHNLGVEITNQNLELFTESNFNENLVGNEELYIRISAQTNVKSLWTYPGLILNSRFSFDPNDSYIYYKPKVDTMVGAQPLYLAGTDMNILDRYISDYPELFQRRVLKYQIKNRDLSVLPQQQFGYIQTWDFLNYLPLDVVRDYLRQTYNLLRPGGIFMFSYSNCNNVETAKLADQGIVPYCTDQLMFTLLAELGYKLVSANNLCINVAQGLDRWVSWIEVSKPGELSTVKKHPAIGKIGQK